MKNIRNDMLQKKISFIMPSHSWNFKFIGQAGYKIIDPYKGNKLLFRIFREIWFRGNLPVKSIWYNKNAKINSSIIVVMDSLITPDYMKWLRDQNPESRIILCYENRVNNTIDSNKLPNTWCEKWSGDPEDCERYGLRYIVGGGYFRFHKVEKKEPKYDIFYIGRDKGRTNKLFELKDVFESRGLRTYFYITATRKYQRFNKPYYRPPIPYDQVLDLLSESRAVLHLTKGGQTGVTIRVLESLINEVKLITDNQMLTGYDFYDKDNIFVLGKDDLDTLPSFLDKPYKPVNDDILERYYFDNFWNNIARDEG